MLDAARMAAKDPLAEISFSARIYVIPERKVMFTSLAKNACTTLKWLIADVAGEDLASLDAGMNPYPNRVQAVHDRTLWKQARRMVDVPEDVRRQIHADNGWFVFAVVRDPRSRFFSAWQQKFLLNNPGYRRWRDEAWYPRTPDSAETIVEDFGRFTEMLLTTKPWHELRRLDTHFRTQRNLLRRKRIPYSRIYEIRELETLRSDLEKHLRDQGWDRDLTLMRTNDTPLRANPAVFANGVREMTESLYAFDFQAFGDRWDFARIEKVPAWTDAELHEVRVRRDLGGRLGDVLELGLQACEDAERLRKQNERLRVRLTAAQEAHAEPIIRQAARRLRNRVSRAR